MKVTSHTRGLLWQRKHQRMLLTGERLRAESNMNEEQRLAWEIEMHLRFHERYQILSDGYIVERGTSPLTRSAI